MPHATTKMMCNIGDLARFSTGCRELRDLVVGPRLRLKGGNLSVCSLQQIEIVGASGFAKPMVGTSPGETINLATLGWECANEGFLAVLRSPPG
jgi:hypothetical protein